LEFLIVPDNSLLYRREENFEMFYFLGRLTFCWMKNPIFGLLERSRQMAQAKASRNISIKFWDDFLTFPGKSGVPSGYQNGFRYKQKGSQYCNLLTPFQDWLHLNFPKLL
jgi:hypothetical protein